MEKSYGSMGTRVGEITTVGISDTIRSDLGIKGGGLPQFQLPDVADVEFVYLLNPNISVNTPSSLPARQQVTDTAFTATANMTSSSAQTITVPDGANKVFAAFKRTDAGAAAALYVQWDFSYDGTTWFGASMDQGGGLISQNGVIVSTSAGALSSSKYMHALPKYVRAAVTNNDAVTTATGILTIVVG